VRRGIKNARVNETGWVPRILWFIDEEWVNCEQTGPGSE
jgi:hypothetical protein